MRVCRAGLELSGLDIVREGPVSDRDGSEVTRERTSRNRPNGATTREDEDASDGNLQDPESEEAGGSLRQAALRDLRSIHLTLLTPLCWTFGHLQCVHSAPFSSPAHL